MIDIILVHMLHVTNNWLHLTNIRLFKMLVSKFWWNQNRLIISQQNSTLQKIWLSRYGVYDWCYDRCIFPLDYKHWVLHSVYISLTQWHTMYLEDNKRFLRTMSWILSHFVGIDTVHFCYTWSSNWSVGSDRYFCATVVYFKTSGNCLVHRWTTELDQNNQHWSLPSTVHCNP